MTKLKLHRFTHPKTNKQKNKNNNNNNNNTNYTPESLAAKTGSPILRRGTNHYYGDDMALRGLACHT